MVNAPTAQVPVNCQTLAMLNLLVLKNKMMAFAPDICKIQTRLGRVALYCAVV